MKLRIRKPSLRKSISARTSLKRAVRHNLGGKAPRGMGWITDPKRAASNRRSAGGAISLWTLLARLFRS